MYRIPRHTGCNRRHQAGFTIIELMIATLIFSTILIILTFSVLAASEHYYKGVVQSEVQNTARSIMSTLSTSVQFNSPVQYAALAGQIMEPYQNGLVDWVCIGNQIFVYQPGYELENTANSAKHQVVQAFIQGTLIGGSCPTTGVSLGASGITVPVSYSVSNQTELLGTNMRLSNLVFSQVGSQGAVHIALQVTYGDDDLLNPASNPTATNVTCADQIGFQFCAYSQLSTVVQPRT